MKHYYQYVKNIRTNGFANAVWDDGGDFGMYKRAQRTWDYTKDVILLSHESGPDAFNINYDENSSSIGLNWVNKSSYNSIIIERSINNAAFTQLATLDAGATSYTDNSISGFGYYAYRVVANVNQSTSYYSYPQQHYIMPTERSAYNNTPAAIPGVVEAEAFDEGGEGLTFHDADTENLGGAFRTTEVDIAQMDAGGYHVAYVNYGEWLEYTINVAKEATYVVKALVASDDMGGAFTLKVGNETSGSIQFSETGGWQVNNTITFEMKLPAGKQILRVEMDANGFNLDKLIFESKESDTPTASPASVKPKASIYPNPVGDRLTVASDKVIECAHILSINGVPLMAQEFNASSINMNTSELTPGCYMLVLEYKDGTKEVVKLMK